MIPKEETRKLTELFFTILVDFIPLLNKINGNKEQFKVKKNQS